MNAEDSHLLGVFEISELAHVSPQAVTNWRKRFEDFPSPVADLRSGPVFDEQQVRRWLRKRRQPVAHVISTINLKGGVGKTTTTVALAEFLSAEFGKRVLVIDLDPQTNATVMLIGETKWKDLNDAGHTLAQLFRDALQEDVTLQGFDLEKTLQTRVSNVSDVRRVDLLPSSLDLIEIQDLLGSMPRGQFFANNPTDILHRATRDILDDYDYVLIDCPPNLGLITLNGLRLSQGYVIPVIPDFLSTYGIPQIKSRIARFAQAIGETIDPLGIVVSKYRTQSTVHNNIVRQLEEEEDAPLFETEIPENNQIAAAAEFVQVSTLRQKYGYAGQFNAYKALTKEFIESVEG